jgi:hypothetical protein
MSGPGAELEVVLGGEPAVYVASFLTYGRYKCMRRSGGEQFAVPAVWRHHDAVDELLTPSFCRLPEDGPHPKTQVLKSDRDWSAAIVDLHLREDRLMRWHPRPERRKYC